MYIYIERYTTYGKLQVLQNIIYITIHGTPLPYIEKYIQKSIAFLEPLVVYRWF